MLPGKIIRLLMLTVISVCTLSLFNAGAQVTAAASGNIDSAAYWKKVIESSPGNLAAHESYIKETGLKDENLLSQYEAWMAKYPREANIPLAIGTALYNRESPKATAFLKRTVAINPKQAKVYQMLAIDAERWGNETAAREYMGKASETEPDDPSYAFYHAMDFEHIDPAQWRIRLYALAKKFPESERGAQGLYWLAARSTDPAEKLRVYELLRTSYPPQKFSWSASGMSALYDIYLEKSPQKALEMAKELASMRGWSGKDTLAQNIIQVRSLLSKGKAAEAGVIAEQIKTPRYSGAADMIALLKAEVRNAAGNSGAAYDSLVVLFAKTPSDELRMGIDKYGKKLGKSKTQTEADIWKIRDAATKPAPPFNLGLYTTDGTASLDNYKGKVVLLTFWFPGCGPCRGEFPHFEAVLKNFSQKEVAYLGINVVPEQDEYVIPFMEGTGYTFTPLRATAEWAQEVYKVRGQPTNFLIDQNGQIVFSNFRTDANNHRELELMISSLLKRS